jgi:circadian clock protein KaiB
MEKNQHSPKDSVRRAEEPDSEKYLIRLYVAGLTFRSTETLARLKTVCEEHLRGRYELEVIDIYQQPELAQEGQIVVTPTLIKVLPAPLRRLVGDLHDTQRVLRGLNIERHE